MNKFILFEGLDRTGKSIAAKEVARVMNAAYFHSPPKLLMPYREYFDSLEDETNFSFYLTANHVLDYQIAQTRKEKNTICDRFFFTTAAYHGEKLGRNVDYIINQMKSIPDRIYYLTGEISVLDERASNTNLKNPRFHGKDLWERVSLNYDRLFEGRENVVKIDATNNSEKEVLEIILNDLKHLIH